MRRILSIGLASAALVLATATAHAAVSVDEIIRLHTAGLSDQSLLLVVSASDTPDTLSTAQLTQMIEAHVPDTVISAMVGKADAVMEDWQPVNVDSVMNGRQIYTETEVYNVYPGWGGSWGWPGYGWCGTPYYGGWWGNSCAAPYPGLYVGVGWYGNWSIGFGFGGGYCGYNDPWYYGGYYGGWGSGYCGNWGGGYCADPYPSYGDGSSYRVIDRPNYHNGASRGASGGGTATPYAQDPFAGTTSTLSRTEGRKLTTVDGSRRAADRGQLRDGGTTTPTTKSSDNLDRLSTPRTDKTTLAMADKGDGRFIMKGDDKQLRDVENNPGRTLGTLGDRSERSESLNTGSTKADRSVQNQATRGLETNSAERKASTENRVTEATRGAVHKSTASPGTATTGEKVNRYVQMKNAQRTTGDSRGNRAGVASRQHNTAGRSMATPSGSRGGGSATQGPKQLKSGKDTGKAPAATGNRSTPSQFGRSGGTSNRATPSAGAPSRPSGGGGMRSGGGGGGGARSGGGGSRGGGGGARGGGGRGGR